MSEKVSATIDDMIAAATEAGAAYLKATARDASGGFRYMVAVVVDEETASDLDRLHDVYDESEAPVSVMCAAPDLLAALEDAVYELRNYTTDDMGYTRETVVEIIKEADAAIAKARGEVSDV